MNMKKKLAISTLAVSLVASAFAGLPLSNKGLAEKLGFSNVAYATVSLDASTLKTKLAAVHAQLTTDGHTAIDRFQQSVDAVTDYSLINTIAGKLGISDNTKKQTLFNLFKAAATAVYDPDLSALESLRTDSAVQSLLTELDPTNQLTVATIETFVLSIETKSLQQLNSLGWSGRLQLLSDSNEGNAARKSFITAVLNSALSDTSAGVGKYLSDHSISGGDVANEMFALQDAIDAAGTTKSYSQVSKNAFIQLAMAYYKYKALSTSAPPSGGTTPPPSDTQNPEAVKAGEAIKNIKDQLKDAPPTQKDELIKKAVQTAQEAANSIGTVDMSKSVKTEGDKASVVLNVDEMKKKIDDIKKSSEDLDAKLKDLDDSVKVKRTLTVDLGDVKVPTGSVIIPSGVLTSALISGIVEASVVVGGASVTIPVNDYQKDTTIDITKKDPEDAKKATNLPIKSSVYDFSMSVDNQPVHQFNKPVKVAIPLNDDPSNDVDIALLTLAKLINDKLQYYGGRVVGNHFVENRDSFSSYVVVENKVSFSDVASVKAWAGRQIEVIAAKGAIVGKSEGIFAPQDSVTRGEFAKMLIAALDLDNRSAKENFADVQESDWFAPYVAAAVNEGIVAGRSADKFEPNATITRAEMVAMITRALKVTNNLDVSVKDADAVLKSYSDASSIHPSLKSNVAYAVSKGLLFGDAGALDPNGKATRAQAAVMIYRVLNYTE